MVLLSQSLAFKVTYPNDTASASLVLFSKLLSSIFLSLGVSLLVSPYPHHSQPEDSFLGCGGPGDRRWSPPAGRPNLGPLPAAAHFPSTGIEGVGGGDLFTQAAASANSWLRVEAWNAASVAAEKQGHSWALRGQHMQLRFSTWLKYLGATTALQHSDRSSNRYLHKRKERRSEAQTQGEEHGCGHKSKDAWSPRWLEEVGTTLL